MRLAEFKRNKNTYNLIKKTSQHLLSLLCQRKRKCWRWRLGKAM